MNLSDYELLPGVVISVKDDEHLGRIKVALPCAESTSNTQLNALPWCYPISMTGTYQGFTKLVDNCKVWVLRNKLDKLEMWYWPMMDLNPNTEDIISSYDNPDVLISRDLGGQNVYIYYTDGKGIVLSIGGSQININAKGEIILTTGEGTVKVSGENVFINTDSSTSHATRSEQITSCLKTITKCLLGIQEACNGSWTTAHVPQSPNFASNLKELNSIVNESHPAWESENVFVK